MTSQIVLHGSDDIYGMTDRPSLSLGGVQPDHVGSEVVVLASEQLNVIYRLPGGGWSHSTVFDGAGMVGDAWGARAGDYDPSLSGSEILMIYEGVMDRSTGTIYAHVGGAWQENLVYSGEVGMDSAAGEFNPDHLGAEIIFPTEMGPTYEIVSPARSARDPWPIRTVWDSFDHAGWVVEIADVDPDHAGNEVVYGTRYSNSVLVSSHSGPGPHDVEIAFVGSTVSHPRNIWDIAVGDVLPEVVGQEIVAVDNSGHVYLVWHEGGIWRGDTIWTGSPGPLFAVVTGDFAEWSEGEEILVAGQAGRLTLLERTATSVPDDSESGANLDLLAIRNCPNPFASRTTFTFRQPCAGNIRLTVFDISGREVAVLVDDPVDDPGARGDGSVVWDGRNGDGREVASGVYCARLETRAGVSTRKTLLLR
ncbi:MAG: hypothetical protein ABIK85_04345 [Candidatus Eisenbacteria bacterium]